jgi:transposase-like protein/IS1 family transposase
MTCHFCSANAKKYGTYGPEKTQRYRCLHCGKTFTAEERMDGMYISVDKAVQVINLLVEGVGINAAARIASIDKETILRLLVKAGEHCEKILDATIKNLTVAEIQADEIWTFVGKKQNHLKPTDDPSRCGDFYTFVGIDRTTKLVISFLVGKRTSPCAIEFMRDLGERITSDVQISTDSFGAYRAAVRSGFGPEIDYGQIYKIYARKSDGRYSPPACIGAVRTPISGAPIESKICTSHIERSNLSMRTFMRRLTRLCLGFSKKVENLKYAVALYFAWYNFCRIHSTLRVTPAMAAGIATDVWPLDRLLT